MNRINGSRLTIVGTAAALLVLLSIAPQVTAQDIRQERLKIAADDGENSDSFGSDVAISGSTAIVGAPRDDDNGSSSGSAYLFDVATGTQIAKLLPNDGVASDRFGASVAISRSTAVVGATADGDNGFLSGSA